MSWDDIIMMGFYIISGSRKAYVCIMIADSVLLMIFA